MVRKYAPTTVLPEKNVDKFKMNVMYRNIDLTLLERKLMWIDTHEDKKTIDVLKPNEVSLIIATLENKYGDLSNTDENDYLYKNLQKSLKYGNKIIKRDDDYPFND